ncbi:hypothetical protein TWF281_000211 [Arthrobotrys megalospora]
MASSTRHPKQSPSPPQSPSQSQSSSSFSTSISTFSQTNNNRQHIRDEEVYHHQQDPSKKPFTSSSYRSRFSNNPPSIPKGYSRPKKRQSIFTEELDSDFPSDDVTSTNSNIASSKNSSRQPSILSVNPLKAKESYIMQLPVQPFRISIILLFLVAFTTISLSTSAEADLDALLLKRVPGEESVVERREASIAPSFRIGPAVRNPEKDIPKLRTGLLVLVISLVFAGLMT